MALEQGEDIAEFAARTPPIVVPETMDVIKLLAVLRRAKGRLVVVTNEFGVVQGLVTPLDVLEAIAGEFPDEDETPDIVAEGDGWLVKGEPICTRWNRHWPAMTWSAQPQTTPPWRGCCWLTTARCRWWGHH